MEEEQALAAGAEQAAAERNEAAVAAQQAATSSAMAVAGTSDNNDLVEQLKVGTGVNAADSMELCSTAELVDLFSEYYDDDRARIGSPGNYLLNDSSADGDIDFNHPALTASGEQAAAASFAPTMPNLGVRGQLNIENMVSA